MIQTAITALLTFISTNIDDIFILMLLYAQAENKKDTIKITTGQYLGMFLLVGAGLAGAVAARALPEEWTRFLGIVPMILGVKTWLDYRKNGEEDVSSSGCTMLRISSVMLLTVANGGDNIGIYIPVFGRFATADMAVLLAIFFLMTALWCFAGSKLAGLEPVKRIIQKYQHILVPFVLIGLGIYILVG